MKQFTATHKRSFEITVITLALVLLVLTCSGIFSACAQKETVVIYTSAEDYRIEYMQKCLEERFPQYKIILNYMSTGNHAAVLLATGSTTECDITYDLEYPYLQRLDQQNILANLSDYDKSIYADDVKWSDNFIIESRNGGSIILNTEVLEERNLPEPTSYEDLLNPEYKNLISMPSPKSSGTGYMFLKSLINAWGEQKAFAYFDKLSENMLHYTSSGSGPVNDLKKKEVAIGIGMTGQAVTELNNGAPFRIVFFEEGSPFTLYGQAIIKGKETRQCVKDVFDYLISEYNELNNKLFFPEKIFKNADFTSELVNFPQNIRYADMTGNTYEEKQILLEKWTH